jgi:hypothetical protein
VCRASVPGVSRPRQIHKLASWVDLRMGFPRPGCWRPVRPESRRFHARALLAAVGLAVVMIAARLTSHLFLGEVAHGGDEIVFLLVRTFVVVSDSPDIEACS